MTRAKPDKNRQKAQKCGLWGEKMAALGLFLKGYKIVERGFRTKSGEIDIIARKGNLVAIVEVKARKNEDCAINAVSHKSQCRITNATNIWLSRQKDYNRLSVRFDIIAIVPGKWPKHFPGAF